MCVNATIVMGLIPGWMRIADRAEATARRRQIVPAGTSHRKQFCTTTKQREFDSSCLFVLFVVQPTEHRKHKRPSTLGNDRHQADLVPNPHQSREPGHEKKTRSALATTGFTVYL